MTPLEALQHEWILEGLPEKVLQHHKKMFCQPEDRRLLQRATKTEIQGFPPNAQTQSIYEIVDEIQREHQAREKLRAEREMERQLKQQQQMAQSSA